VNLATGIISGGALVDGGRNFDGGFAIAPGVPEPSTFALAALAAALGIVRQRRSS
jgi:hypothetical protein